MRKLKGYQKFNEELSTEKQIQEQLAGLDEFVRVQLQDIDPNGDRFQYETYCPHIDGRRSLAGRLSDWNIALILDTSEYYDGIDLNELWPIMEGIEEYLKYQCDNIQLDRLIGVMRDDMNHEHQTLTEDMRETDNWQWVGAKFILK